MDKEIRSEILHSSSYLWFEDGLCAIASLATDPMGVLVGVAGMCWTWMEFWAGLPGLPEVTPPGEAGTRVSRYILNLMFQVLILHGLRLNVSSYFFECTMQLQFCFSLLILKRFCGERCLKRKKMNSLGVSITAKVRRFRKS